MKTYVITGSLGHISKELVKGLVKAGKTVRVITSSQDRVADIKALGAEAFVGSVADVNFLNTAFEGADVAYTMVPPIWQTNDWRASQKVVVNALVQAVQQAGIKYVVSLSSLGAHLEHGNGPIGGVYDLEQALNKIPGLNVKHLRPGFFYYNLLNQIGLVQQAGILGANYGADKILLVDPKDIATVALDELLQLSFTGNSVRYIFSDERTGQEIAEILGKAIGKQLPWVVFTDEQQLAGLLGAGLPETHAKAFTEMGKGYREGTLQTDAVKNMPAFSATKLEAFAVEFAKAYEASQAKVVA